AGWFLARAGLAHLPESVRRRCVIKAFAILLAIGPLVGLLGGLLGVVLTEGSDLDAWREMQQRLNIDDLRAFVIVAYLHTAGYLGAVLGLVCAIVYVRRQLAHCKTAL